MTEFIILLIWVHFAADFIFQNDKIALNKSSSIKYLALHSIIYGGTFVILAPYIVNHYWGYMLFLSNTILHFIVDFFTSKLTTYLWKEEERHWFFVVIGVDQSIHITSLILIYYFYTKLIS